MTADLDRWLALKKQDESERREIDRARGAMDQLLSRLKEGFGCETAKEGRKLLERERAEQEAASARFSHSLEEFETERGGP
jgi:hypothetical protein